jgi:hypothetical protein
VARGGEGSRHQVFWLSVHVQLRLFSLIVSPRDTLQRPEEPKEEPEFLAETNADLRPAGTAHGFC